MSERTTPLGELFAWRPAGVGQRAVPCPSCRARTRIRILENVLETLCGSCGRNLALEHARRLEKEQGSEALARALVASGILEDGELPRPVPPSGLLDRLIEERSLARDVLLSLELDPAQGTFAYVGAPLAKLARPEEVERALETRKRSGGALSDHVKQSVLARLGADVRAHGDAAGLERWQGKPRDVPAAARDLLPARAVELYRALPVAISEDGALVVARDEPLDLSELEDLERIAERPVEVLLATGDAFPAAATASAANDALDDDELGDDGSLEIDDDAVDLDDEAALLDELLLEALEEGADEVELAPLPDRARVTFRARGERRAGRTFSRELLPLLVDRLASLAPGRARRPASTRRRPVLAGRLALEVSGLPVSIEYRVIATALGPLLSLLLDDEDSAPRRELAALGLEPDERTELERELARGDGLIVVASPPRGGKTSLVYALAERAASLGASVVTVERRIGRVLEGAIQIEASLEHDRALAQALARPRPDWLVLDEASGARAARAAAESALEGRGVIAAVAARDGESALARLERDGVPASVLGRAARIVVARRLPPRICPRCRVARRPSPERLVELGIGEVALAQAAIGLGCASCAGRGAQGRSPLIEVARPHGDALEPVGAEGNLRSRAAAAVARGEVALEDVADLLRRGTTPRPVSREAGKVRSRGGA